MSARKVAVLSAVDGREAGRLVQVGGMLFSSSILALDLQTGRCPADPKAQADLAFRNLGRLLQLAGVSPSALGLVTICVGDAAHAKYVDDAWRAMFGDRVVDRPARKINEFPLPAGELVQLQVVGVCGENRRSVVLPGFTARSSAPLGVRLRNVVFSSTIDGRDPATGQYSENVPQQMSQAFRNMAAFLTEAGTSKNDLIHVFIFICGRRDQQNMLNAWLREFPLDGNRPARKAIFDDTLTRQGVAIQLMCVAVAGKGERRNLEAPGISKSHPNPMGCRIGDLVFTSGIGGNDPAGIETSNAAGIRAALALANARALLENAGGTLADVGMVSITVNDYADEQAILRQWDTVFPDPLDQPARHVMAFGGRGSYPVQLHVIAALERQ